MKARCAMRPSHWWACSLSSVNVALRYLSIVLLKTSAEPLA